MEQRSQLRQDAAKRNATVPSARTQIQNQSKDPIAFWDDYYSKPHANDNPEDVLALVALLRVDKKFRDIEGVLRGYLRHHSDLAEVWMYDTLVVAIDINKGDPEEAKVLTGYAAHLARQSENPNDLFQVADILLLRNWLEPVGTDGYKANLGEILDRLQKRVPHRIEPYQMEMLLAERTQNPARMAEVAESILSLGWPGSDPQVREQINSHAKTLAASLKKSGRTDEAKVMLDRLSESNTVDVWAKLTWKGTADLDLVVSEPLGADADYNTPRTVFGGSLISNGRGTQPESSSEEVYLCPRGFNGTYRFQVKSIYNSPEDPKQKTASALLEIILHKGTANEIRKQFPINLNSTTIAPVTIELTNGRRTEVLPFLAPQAAPPIPKRVGNALNKQAGQTQQTKPIGPGGMRKSTGNDSTKPKAIVVPDYEPKSIKAIDLTKPAKP